MQQVPFEKRSIRWKEIKGGLCFFETKYGIKGFYGSGVIYAGTYSNVCSNVLRGVYNCDRIFLWVLPWRQISIKKMVGGISPLSEGVMPSEYIEIRKEIA